MRVIVVGGGWAGLAAAVELSAHGAEVTLVEAAPQLGGRARTVERRGLRFDNGQHLVIGAYREILRLLTLCGVAEETVFLRTPLRWLVHHSAQRPLDIVMPAWLPAPLHTLWALLNARGYHWRERAATLRACAAVLRAPAGTGDISVQAWLQRTRQPARVVETLWGPLCLAALNTPIAYASAKVFARVLRDAFLRRRADADLLIARRDLGAVLPAPAAKYIEGRGGRIYRNERVGALLGDAGRITGVRGRRGDHHADHVVLALPPNACAALIAPYPALAPLATQLAAFEYEAICTLYLRYASPPPFAAPMLGMVGRHGQWLFDLGDCGKPGWIAAVISGPGDHLRLANEALLAAVAGEIAALWGDAAPPYLDGFVIREKRATFSCRVGIDAARPPLRTALAGLWLAGDFTATGYPATLEGAVRSGVACARAIMRA